MRQRQRGSDEGKFSRNRERLATEKQPRIQVSEAKLACFLISRLVGSALTQHALTGFCFRYQLGRDNQTATNNDETKRTTRMRMTMKMSGALLSVLLSPVLAAQPSAPQPVPAPLRDLEWGQLNILHTTDTHGWFAGHLQEYGRSLRCVDEFELTRLAVGRSTPQIGVTTSPSRRACAKEPTPRARISW